MKIAKSISGWLPAALLLAAALPMAAQSVGITMSSTNLQFSHQAGGSTLPFPQSVRVFSAPDKLPFTAEVVSAGTPWLLVNNATATSGTTGTTGQDLEVRANPVGLGPGEYTGRIDVRVQGAATMTITTRLVVAATPQIVISQGSLILNAQAGTATLVNVPITSTSLGSIPFTATVSGLAPATPAWLSVTPTGNTGTNATIVADATALPAGLATGTVVFSVANGGSVTIPVALYIAATATLNVSPASTTIGFQTGSTPPGARQINVAASTNATIPYTAEVVSGTWLSVSATPGSTVGTASIQSTTPNPFYVIANPAGLAVGTQEGRIRISSPNLPSGPREITVRLIVSNLPILQSLPESLTFSHQVGAPAEAAKTIGVSTSSGVPVTITPTASTDAGGQWLVATKLSESQVQVSLNQTVLATMTAGTYTGKVSITAPGTANSPLEVPVTLTVSGSTLITVSSSLVQFATEVGGTAPTAQSFEVRATDGSNQPFTVAIDPAATNWLAYTTNSTRTPALVTLNLIQSAITQAGNLEAFVVITPTGVPNATPQRVRVNVTVVGQLRITAAPTRLDFTQTGATVPAPQTVTLTSTTPGRSFIASPSQPWIRVSSTSGEFGASGFPLSVSVDPAGLTSGVRHEGEIRIISAGVQDLRIPVSFSLNVATLTATPTQLPFTYQLGGTTPVDQQIAVASTGAAVPFTAAAAVTTPAAGTWLRVNPPSGTTAAAGGAPTPLTVSVNPAGLPAGTYQGTVTLTPQSGGGAPVQVNVTLTVTAPGAPILETILNAATLSPTQISPGLIIAIKGRNLGPATELAGQIQAGVLTSERGGVRVLFDGVPAPLLYVSAGQINLVAPYFIANRTTTRVSVEYLGQRSEALEFRVVETAPGLFTANATGSGQGSFLNQDGTVNSLTNPAARGTVVSLYATGEGQTIPAGQDGRIIQPVQSDLRRPAGTVSVNIGGRAAEVVYAGSAPTLVSGAFQVNVRIPANLAVTAVTGVPVELRVGNGTTATTQSNVLLHVRP